MGAASERLYEWAGARYLKVIALGTLAAVSALVVPAYSALLIPIYDLRPDTYLRVVLIWEAFMIPFGALGMWVMLTRTLGPVERWCAGERGSSVAARVWRSAVPGLPRAVGSVLVAYVLGSVGAVILVGLELDFPARGYPLYFMVIVALVGVVGVAGFLCFEQLLRPIVREAVAALPAETELPGGTTLSVKALLVVPVISFLTGVVVVAFAIRDLAPELYLAVGVGSSLFVSLTVGSVLARALRTSLVGRVDTLREAMQAVDRGELDVEVPPLAGDEIDEIGRSFNQMLAGLRERAALREDLQASRARIVAASDLARRRVERDLHDGAQQHLVLLRLRLTQLRSQLEPHNEAALKMVDEAEADVQDALRELRDLAHGIYPTMLESDGLPGALRGAARRAGISATVVCAQDRRYPREVETAVYFSCLEALQNAAKHAGEKAQASVSLSDDEGVLCFEIADDGPGFDTTNGVAGDGLHNMADRIGAVGGTLEVDTAPGTGTRIRGRIPVG